MSNPSHAPVFGDPSAAVDLSTPAPEANGADEATESADDKVVAGVKIQKGLKPEKPSRGTKWNLVARAMELNDSVDVASSGMAQSCRKAIQELHGKGSAQSYKLESGEYRVFRVA